MNIFEIAIEMEIEGAAYYTKLANKTVNEGLKINIHVISS